MKHSQYKTRRWNDEVYGSRIERVFSWKPWNKLFKAKILEDELNKAKTSEDRSKIEAKIIKYKLKAGAKMLAYARDHSWHVGNITHVDPDGLMSAKLLKMFFEKEDEYDYSFGLFHSYQETEHKDISRYTFKDLKLTAPTDRRSGALLISTDLRMSECYCERLDHLQQMLDAPLLSIDHHIRGKRINTGPKKPKNEGVKPDPYSIEDIIMEVEFKDYWKRDNAGGKAHDWGIEEKTAPQPFLDIDTCVNRYPATLLVYNMVELASDKVKNPPNLKKMIPFAAIGLMGDKADLKLGKDKPLKKTEEIIEEAKRMVGKRRLSLLKDWIEMIGYSIPDLLPEVWKEISSTDDVRDLLKPDKTIPRFGKSLSEERRRIKKKFWRSVTPKMEKYGVYHYRTESTLRSNDYGYNNYNFSMGVSLANVLSEENRSDFFAICAKTKNNHDFINSEERRAYPEVYKVYLRRSDGKVNLNDDVLEYMCKGRYKKGPERKGGRAAGEVVFYTEEDLALGLKKYTKRCIELRKEERFTGNT